MKIPTEPIGSIPRSSELIDAITSISPVPDIQSMFNKAVDETLLQFQKTGSPVVSDGEQSKASFVTYPLHGSKNLESGGMKINFVDGHHRQLPLLTKGPFRYANYASQYLQYAQNIQTFLSNKQ